MPSRERDHEGAALAGACAVREDERRIGFPVRPVDERRRRARPERNLKLT